MLVELVSAVIGEPFRRGSRAHPVIAGLGTFLLGGLAGALANLVWPMRVLRVGPVRGASVVLSPIVVGTIMERYGQWREGRGRARSFLDTFWGGAVFAFSMALVRFVWVMK